MQMHRCTVASPLWEKFRRHLDGLCGIAVISKSSEKRSAAVSTDLGGVGYEGSAGPKFVSLESVTLARSVCG